MKPKIAIHILPQHASYEKIRDAAIRAEEIGADIIYNWDHFYPLFKEDGSNWDKGERREGKHFGDRACLELGTGCPPVRSTGQASFSSIHETAGASPSERISICFACVWWRTTRIIFFKR